MGRDLYASALDFDSLGTVMAGCRGGRQSRERSFH